MPSHSVIPSPQEESVFELLGKLGKKRVYPKNSIVLNEGDPSSFLYVIHTGRLKVFLSDEQGREIVINIMGPGEYFGEMSLIDNEARSASVMTVEDSQLTLVSRSDFSDCLAENPELAFPLMLGLIKRLRNATKKIGSLALMDVYGRVASTLLQLASEQDNQLVIEKKLTHQELANIVGASREMVSKIMHDLTEGGYVSVDSRKRIILNEKL
ncbi:MAG: Crp/Fnr family transcriptional regulator [Burkholderiales bacterium]|nr:Crp/Fnr family transcriptional regulator [Burkholderiales bacterium]